MIQIINSLKRKLFFIAFISIFLGDLSGAIIPVGPPPASIQAAINSAAASGDTIQLSAGTYVQQVQVISKSLNIVGTGQNNTIIQSPGPLTPLTQFFTFGPNNFWCVLMIDNQAAPTPQIVNISNLTVDGDFQQDTTTLPAPSPGFYGSSNRFFAIGYHNAGGTIQNVHTTNTRQSINFNELAGGGIENASDTGVVTFNINNCLIDFYQRQGIDCRGTALTAHISNSTINRGFVLPPNTSTATPNGIQYSGSTTGSMTNNLVEGNIATVLNAPSAGILPFGAGANLLISGNAVNNNDLGIVAIGCADNLVIQNNILNFTTTPGVNSNEGIVVQDTFGLTTITSNIMNNIPDINMDLSTTSASSIPFDVRKNIQDVSFDHSTLTGSNQPFHLALNRFIGSQVGLLVSGSTGTPSTGPVITMNRDVFTGTIGYYIQENTAPNNAPNDIWPSTATVRFDGLISGQMTLAQFNQTLTKIFDKHNDPADGLVLDFIPPAPPIPPIPPIPPRRPCRSCQCCPSVLLPPSHFMGVIKEKIFFNNVIYILKAKWDASLSKDVVLYRIYNERRLVAEINAECPLIFLTRVRSKNAAENYRIVTVNAKNEESSPVSIRLNDKNIVKYIPMLMPK